MTRFALLLPLLAFAPSMPLASGGRQPPVSEATPPPGFHQIKLNGHTFTLPVGFTIELAAKPPLADRPIAAAFDEKGRLYVTDSSGSNEKVADQLQKKPHRIVRLTDTNGDGVFDTSTVYVPNIMFPEGAMWLNGSLYVAAPPHILKFTDTDDDGKADKEEIWFDGKTLTGCANDLHGPYLGPDGWIYWCKGAFAKQEHTLPNGKKWTTRAAHIFRAKPDGTNIEPVMTGGMDNPVDVIFTPGGERIFNTTFLQHPAGGKRDGLIHAVYGGVWGKDHDPIYEHPWTSPTLMPPMTHLGPAAPAGLHRYESDQFGPDYANNVFCCQFNMRKVSRHILVPTGSTFTTKDSDFVVSDNLDFHPTDVIEDADGSLLIVDTGGWYKLCCPTSQLVKPDVTGAIYRVKKVGAHKVDDPRGDKIDWKAKPEEIAKLLGDPRPVVRWKAVDTLGRNTPENWETIRSVFRSQSEIVQLHAVWAASRMNNHTLLFRLLDIATYSYSSEAVQIALVHACSVCREPDLLGGLRMWPKFMDLSARPHLRRVLAEAYGRFGNPVVIPHILGELANEKNDRMMDHSLTYALIEIGDPKATAEGLKDKSPRVRRAALAALNAMPGDHLDPKAVIAELDAKDAALRDTAWWVAGKHPAWGEHLVGYFRTQLAQADKLPPAARDDLADRLTKFTKNEAVQAMIGDVLTEAKGTGPTRLLLRVVARSGAKAMPPAWAKALAAAAPAMGDRDTFRDALAAFRAVPATEEEVHTFVDAAPRGQLWPGGVVPDEFRLAILAARPVGSPLVPAQFQHALDRLARDEPAPVRAAAIDVLTRAKLTPPQLVTVAAGLRTVGPIELGKALDLFAKSTDETAGLALLTGVSDPAVRGLVRADMVKPILEKYPKAVKDEAEKLYAELAAARKDETAKLDRLVKELPAGDIRRGQLVFNGPKAQCISCHKMGYVGGPVGPDLTRIGGIRSDRDLLEAIVFPSASFVRSYESVRVVTTDGRTLNGILKKDAPDEVIVVLAADKEERIARADVESISPSSVSVMPSGLDQQLSPQELADLVAFLKASK